jgi:hypothetical protein
VQNNSIFSHHFDVFFMWSGNHKFYIQFSRLLRLQSFKITLYLFMYFRELKIQRLHKLLYFQMLPPNPPNTNNSAQSKISMKITAPHGANQEGKKSSNSTEQTTDDRMLVTAFTLHEYGFSCSCFCGNL